MSCSLSSLCMSLVENNNKIDANNKCETQEHQFNNKGCSCERGTVLEDVAISTLIGITKLNGAAHSGVLEQDDPTRISSSSPEENLFNTKNEDSPDCHDHVKDTEHDEEEEEEEEEVVLTQSQPLLFFSQSQRLDDCEEEDGQHVVFNSQAAVQQLLKNHHHHCDEDHNANPVVNQSNCDPGSAKDEVKNTVPIKIVNDENRTIDTREIATAERTRHMTPSPTCPVQDIVVSVNSSNNATSPGGQTLSASQPIESQSLFSQDIVFQEYSQMIALDQTKDEKEQQHYSTSNHNDKEFDDCSQNVPTTHDGTSLLLPSSSSPPMITTVSPNLLFQTSVPSNKQDQLEEDDDDNDQCNFAQSQITVNSEMILTELGQSGSFVVSTVAEEVVPPQIEQTQQNSNNIHNDEDVTLMELERSGTITQIIGSQSLLSQEIAFGCCSHSQPPLELKDTSHTLANLAERHHNDNGENPSKKVSLLDGTCNSISTDNNFNKIIEPSLAEQSKPSHEEEQRHSKELLSPASTARKYGLILPREEEEFHVVTVSANANVLAESAELHGKSQRTFPPVQAIHNLHGNDDEESQQPNCIQEDDDVNNGNKSNEVVEDGRKEGSPNGVIVGGGGETLSQPLDLTGLLSSQDFNGFSQESTALVWEELQSSGTFATVLPMPLVTPATSSTSQDMAVGTNGQPKLTTEPFSLGGGAAGTITSKGGLECLLQAADQVTAQESNTTPRRGLRRGLAKQTTIESFAAPVSNNKSKMKKIATTPAVKTKMSSSTKTKGTAKTGTAKSQDRKAHSAPKSLAPRSVSDNSAPGTKANNSALGKRKVTPEPTPEEMKNKKKAKTLTTAAPASSNSSPSASRDVPQRSYNELAQEAANLAVRVIHEEHLGKQLLLSMVMERQPTRTPPASLPGKGHEMPPSFVWSHYPPLEKVLRDHMEEYYHLSLQKRQSAAQQAFNNELVQIVRQVALDEWGWSIPSLDDKSLRDRIRCYYKTHIQNAKKRLATMLKNPRKVANARHLVHHLDLIRQTLEKNPQQQSQPHTAATLDSRGDSLDDDVVEEETDCEST